MNAQGLLDVLSGEESIKTDVEVAVSPKSALLVGGVFFLVLMLAILYFRYSGNGK